MSEKLSFFCQIEGWVFIRAWAFIRDFTVYPIIEIKSLLNLHILKFDPSILDF